MNSALSPREIQARLRAGASVPEVAAEAGVEVSRIEGFALPVMAERAHMTRTALGASVRRRGDGSGHRRLAEIVRERLQARSLDSDTVEWDAWRQNDLKWRLVGRLDDQVASRAAEFIFDPKGRFSVADNADARWMIGETLPGPLTDPDNENTIDFNDELALVRAISDSPSRSGRATGAPGDEVPPHGSQYDGAAHTSELDELYDMLSGVSEDSVRIYLGLDDEEGSETVVEGAEDSSDDEAPESMNDDDLAAAAAFGPSTSVQERQESRHIARADELEPGLAEELSKHRELDASAASGSQDQGEVVREAFEPTSLPGQSARVFRDNGTDQHTAPEDGAEADGTQSPVPEAPEQDALVPDVAPAVPKRKPAKKRASIPSWDEIMFGGPTGG